VKHRCVHMQVSPTRSCACDDDLDSGSMGPRLVRWKEDCISASGALGMLGLERRGEERNLDHMMVQRFRHRAPSILHQIN
jgi:hypothetical protein